ncbi:MAG: hypothetical protein K0R00_3214 [Herbinix sp.]|nr:hypothetical protein [Herbinix sp.]
MVGDVLAGKTFVNEDGDEIEGTIPNLAGSQNVYVGGTDKYVDIKRHTDNAHARITVKPGFKGYFNENTTMDLYVWNLLVENVKAGIPFGGTDHLMTGTFTADATAIDSDVLSGKTYYRNGVKGTGNIITVLPDNLDHLNERAAPTVGKFSTDNPNTNYAYLNVGSGNYYKKDIAWVRSAQPDLLPENIRSGKNVLGVAGTMVRGKGYAAGTKFVNVSANTYICTNGDYGAGYPMTVSGLSLPFTPSIIIIRLDDHGAAHGDNTLYFKGNVAPCYVTTDGFSLPVLQNGYTYTWIAIE